jgi:hypothetical protein
MEILPRWGWKTLHWTTRLMLAGLCIFWIATIVILAGSYREGGMQAVRTKIAHLQGPVPHSEPGLGSRDVAILQIHEAYQTIIKFLLLTWAVTWLNSKIRQKARSQERGTRDLGQRTG